MPTSVKKWIRLEDQEAENSERSETESYTFNLTDKSKIRSIHYMNNEIHFSPSDYKKFIDSKQKNTLIICYFLIRI